MWLLVATENSNVTQTFLRKTQVNNFRLSISSSDIKAFTEAQPTLTKFWGRGNKNYFHWSSKVFTELKRTLFWKCGAITFYVKVLHDILVI